MYWLSLFWFIHSTMKGFIHAVIIPLRYPQNNIIIDESYQTSTTGFAICYFHLCFDPCLLEIPRGTEPLWPLLRIYPPRFAMRMASLHGRFCVKRSLDFGTMIEENNFNLGISLFESMSWDSSDWWDDAHMKSVFMYLRGAHDLILGSMRPLFPTEIWWGWWWLPTLLPILVNGKPCKLCS